MSAKPSRWGSTDERGAYNLIDAAATLRGIQSVKDGKVVSLAVPIKANSRGPALESRMPACHFMTRDGGDYAAGLPEKNGFGFSDDVVTLPTHGTTHIDALAHIWRDGAMYNNFPASEVTSRGAAKCGIEKLDPIVTRALFVDFGGDPYENHAPISQSQLASAVKRGGIHPEPGDALIVRTGWMAAFKKYQTTTLESRGLHHDCAAWIVDAGFALIAADNVAVEHLPSQDAACAVPLHVKLLRDEGIYFAELLDLDELATFKRAAVMLSIAPLKIIGGVGSPITPVAVL